MSDNKIAKQVLLRLQEEMVQNIAIKTQLVEWLEKPEIGGCDVFCAKLTELSGALLMLQRNGASKLADTLISAVKMLDEEHRNETLKPETAAVLVSRISTGVISLSDYIDTCVDDEDSDHLLKIADGLLDTSESGQTFKVQTSIDSDTYRIISERINELVSSSKNEVEKFYAAKADNINPDVLLGNGNNLLTIFNILNLQAPRLLVEKINAYVQSHSLTEKWSEIAEVLLLTEDVLNEFSPSDEKVASYEAALEYQVLHSKANVVKSLVAKTGKLAYGDYEEFRKQVSTSEQLQTDYAWKELTAETIHYGSACWFFKQESLAKALKSFALALAELSLQTEYKAEVYTPLVDVLVAAEYIFSDLSETAQVNSGDVNYLLESVSELLKVCKPSSQAEEMVNQIMLGEVKYGKRSTAEKASETTSSLDDLLKDLNYLDNPAGLQTGQTSDQAAAGAAAAAGGIGSVTVSAGGEASGNNIGTVSVAGYHQYFSDKTAGQLEGFSIPVNKEEFTKSNEDAVMDDEIREFFIEELDEKISEIEGNIPAWEENINNDDAIGTIRRAFHTIKGSGRTVGFESLGECAWQHESMFNRIIDKTFPPNRFVCELTKDTAKLLRLLRSGDNFIEQKGALLSQAVVAEQLTKFLTENPQAQDAEIEKTLTEIYGSIYKDYSAGATAGAGMAAPQVVNAVAASGVDLQTLSQQQNVTVVVAAPGSDAPAAAQSEASATSAAVSDATASVEANADAIKAAVAEIAKEAAKEAFSNLSQEATQQAGEVPAVSASMGFVDIEEDKAKDIPTAAEVVDKPVAVPEPLTVPDDLELSATDGSEHFDISSLDDAAGGYENLVAVKHYQGKSLADLDRLSIPEERAEFAATTESELTDDDEILSFFLEELDEKIQEIDQAIPEWKTAADPTPHTQTIRRAFHTIKGSGRTVGYQTLGEFAWQHEHLLNGVLDNHFDVNPVIQEAVEDAVDLLKLLRDGDSFVEHKPSLLTQAVVAEKVCESLTQKPDMNPLELRKVIRNCYLDFEDGEGVASADTPTATEEVAIKPQVTAADALDTTAGADIKFAASEVPSTSSEIETSAQAPVQTVVQKVVQQVVAPSDDLDFIDIEEQPILQKVVQQPVAASNDVASASNVAPAASSAVLADISTGIDIPPVSADASNAMSIDIDGAEFDALNEAQNIGIHYFRGKSMSDLQQMSVPAAKQQFVAQVRSESQLVDEEIRSFFLDELDEKIGELDETIPQWRAAPDNTQHTQTIRRAFHTIKGSSRTVGYQSLGEFAWQHEHLMSGVEEKHFDVNPVIQDTVEDAVELLKILREQDEFVEHQPSLLTQAMVAEQVCDTLAHEPHISSEQLRQVVQACYQLVESSAATGEIDPNAATVPVNAAVGGIAAGSAAQAAAGNIAAGFAPQAAVAPTDAPITAGLAPQSGVATADMTTVAGMAAQAGQADVAPVMAFGAAQQAATVSGGDVVSALAGNPAFENLIREVTQTLQLSMEDGVIDEEEEVLVQKMLADKVSSTAPTVGDIDMTALAQQVANNMLGQLPAEKIASLLGVSAPKAAPQVPFVDIETESTATKEDLLEEIYAEPEQAVAQPKADLLDEIYAEPAEEAVQVATPNIGFADIADVPSILKSEKDVELAGDIDVEVEEVPAVESRTFENGSVRLPKTNLFDKGAAGGGFVDASEVASKNSDQIIPATPSIKLDSSDEVIEIDAEGKPSPVFVDSADYVVSAASTSSEKPSENAPKVEVETIQIDAKSAVFLRELENLSSATTTDSDAVTVESKDLGDRSRLNFLNSLDGFDSSISKVEQELSSSGDVIDDLINSVYDIEDNIDEKASPDWVWRMLDALEQLLLLHKQHRTELSSNAASVLRRSVGLIENFNEPNIEEDALDVINDILNERREVAQRSKPVAEVFDNEPTIAETVTATEVVATPEPVLAEPAFADIAATETQPQAATEVNVVSDTEVKPAVDYADAALAPVEEATHQVAVSSDIVPVPTDLNSILDSQAGTELAEMFIDEATVLLNRCFNNVESWTENLDQLTYIDAVRRDLHTLKGSSRMSGYMTIGDFTHEVETMIASIIDGSKPSNDVAAKLLLDSLQQEKVMLDTVRDGYLPVRDEAAFKSIADFLAASNEETVQSATESSVAPAVQVAAAAQETSDSTISAEDVVSVEAEAVTETVSDGNIEEVAVDEVQSTAAVLDAAAAEEIASKVASEVATEVATEVAENIAEKAVSTIEESIAEVAHIVEEVEEAAVVAAGVEVPAEEVAVEAVVTDISTDLDSDEETVGEVNVAASLAGAGFDENIDPDLVAIFTDEANGLVEQIGALLNTELASADELEQLKRALHTMKGGARMVGFTSIGDTSHLMESVIDKFSDLDAEKKGQAKVLLGIGHETLYGMLDSVLRQEMPQEALGLNHSLEVFANSGVFEEPKEQVEHKVEKAEEKAPEIADKKEDKPHKKDKKADKKAKKSAEEKTEQKQEDVPSIEVSESLASELSDIGVAKETSTHSNEEEKKQAGAITPQHYVRVDAELLDEMISMTGEIAIMRSRMENISHQTEFNLNELTRVATRIDEQMRRLDNETEAQMLFRRETQEHDNEHFDPLEMDRFSEIQQLSRQLAEAINDLKNIQDTLVNETSLMRQLSIQQGMLQRGIQDRLIKTQLLRFDTNESRLQRLVRQTGRSIGKDVNFVLEGGAVELERRLIEDIIPAMEHMIRNSIGHGIESAQERKAKGKPEQGTVKVSVATKASNIEIRVLDDGRGLDYDRIREKAREKGWLVPEKENDVQFLNSLLLRSGFSTAKQVTQLSGRGVGMDVVNDTIKQRRGRLYVESVPGKGTQFTILMPFSMSIAETLQVEIAETSYIIPMSSITAISQVSVDELYAVERGDVYVNYDGVDYKLVVLGKCFDPQDYEMHIDTATVPLLFVNSASPVAFFVDKVANRLEVIIKNVNRQVLSLPGISGATVLGDGSVVLVLDLVDLSDKLDRIVAERIVAEAPEEDIQHQILVVDDSVTMRKVSGRLLERNGFVVQTAKDGLDAIEVLRTFTPNLILLDIEMPRMDGFEFAQYVRQDSNVRDVPIIMVTSRTGDKHRERAEAIGVQGYLGKPYREDVLIETIGNLIGGNNG